MKKLGYTLVLASLLLQTGGMLFIYKASQFYVHYQVSLSLKNTQTAFEKIIITSSDYKKSRNGLDEISYKGKMYDIKSIKILSDSVELLVIHDRYEEYILKEIAGFFQSKPNRDDREVAYQLNILFSLHYVSPGTEYIFFIPPFGDNIFHHENLNIISTDSDVHTPPPKNT